MKPVPMVYFFFFLPFAAKHFFKHSSAALFDVRNFLKMMIRHENPCIKSSPK